MSSNLHDSVMTARSAAAGTRTFIDELLEEQRSLTAVDLFSRRNGPSPGNAREKLYRDLIPLEQPGPGRQYAFEVDLDKCSGCKACVSACHSLNGLEEGETWRSVGLLVGTRNDFPSSGEHQDCESSSRRQEAAEAAADVRKQTTVMSAQPNPPRHLDGCGLRESLVQHITTACHHCIDPGCLNGCPVLAYEKDPVTGIVRHLDDQCMGCTYCVMKCPYEVPQYSKRLGIVRKCDMCSNRLAAGEAPVCVQACPDQAIRISIVDQTAPGPAHSRSWKELFAAGAPDPRITVPTTRYISSRILQDNLHAADHTALRLDHSHWPLVIMLVGTQAATGLFLAAALEAGKAGPGMAALKLVALGLLMIGLTSSVLHLGKPLKAWRAFLGWRRSWLSREIMAFGAFAGAAAVAVAMELFPKWRIGPLSPSVTTAVAALVGLVGVFASAMVYVDTRRSAWSPRFAFGNFLGTTLLLGTATTAVTVGWIERMQGTARNAALATIAFGTILFIWRWLELRAALRDPASPVHLNARVVGELLPWTIRLRTVLFLVSILAAVATAMDRTEAAPWWAGVLALSVFVSEIVGRHVFFAAGGARRMPGGVAA